MPRKIDRYESHRGWKILDELVERVGIVEPAVETKNRNAIAWTICKTRDVACVKLERLGMSTPLCHGANQYSSYPKGRPAAPLHHVVRCEKETALEPF